MGNSTGNKDKKSPTKSKNDKAEKQNKTKKKRRDMLGQKEKATQHVKKAIQLEEIN